MWRNSEGLRHIGLGIGEVGAFKEQMFNKPQMLIGILMSKLALPPQFCQYLVMCRFYFLHSLLAIIVVSRFTI
jgi:hypothetical protein